jgi:hypothetical protein
MSKKTFRAAIVMFVVLLSLAAGMQAVKVAKANPIPWAFDPQMTVTIQSPANGATCALPLLVSFTAQGDRQFSVSDNVTQDYARSFFYVLDGQNLTTMGLRFAGTKTTQILGDPIYKYNFSGQANLTDITDGLHNITVYFGAVNKIGLVGTPTEWIVHNTSWQATSQFYVDSTLTPTPTLAPTPSPSPTPTSMPTLEASMAESASALNFGNRVNFTVAVEGGKEPYAYSWYVDNQLATTSTSPYFATDNQTVGSHHVYVEVNDAENHTANTLTVEFNVLPTNPSACPSPTHAQQATVKPTQSASSTPFKEEADNPNPSLEIIGIVAVAAIVAVGLPVYFRKKRG